MKTSTNRDKKSACCDDGDGRKIGAHPDRERRQARPSKVPAAVPLDVESWSGSHCLCAVTCSVAAAIGRADQKCLFPFFSSFLFFSPPFLFFLSFSLHILFFFIPLA